MYRANFTKVAKKCNFPVSAKLSVKPKESTKSEEARSVKRVSRKLGNGEATAEVVSRSIGEVWLKSFVNM